MYTIPLNLIHINKDKREKDFFYLFYFFFIFFFFFFYKMEECETIINEVLEPISREIVYEKFRQRIYNGDQTDINGNKMSIYKPDDDTFFSCLSYSRYGTANKRFRIRNKLLSAAIGIVTGKSPRDVPRWLASHSPRDIRVVDGCNLNPAIDSLAVSIGAPSSLSDRALWISQDVRFKNGFYKFIDNNTGTSEVWLKYTMAYLFCQVYACDIHFYGIKKGCDDVSRISSVCKKQKYKMKDQNSANKWKNDGFTMCNDDEILGLDGVDLITPRDSTPVMTTLKTPRVSMTNLQRNNIAEERSSEEDDNWLAIYLLYINVGKFPTFDLCYTDAERNRHRNPRWLEHNSEYSLRMYEYDEENETHTNKALRKGGAYCDPPPIGRRVHAYRFDHPEKYKNKVLQVAPAKPQPVILRKDTSEDKPTYIYLYYQHEGDNGTALMISKSHSFDYPGDPVFLTTDNVLGEADGIFIVKSNDTDRANSYVEKEMRVVVKMPIKKRSSLKKRKNKK